MVWAWGMMQGGLGGGVVGGGRVQGTYPQDAEPLLGSPALVAVERHVQGVAGLPDAF